MLHNSFYLVKVTLQRLPGCPLLFSSVCRNPENMKSAAPRKGAATLFPTPFPGTITFRIPCLDDSSSARCWSLDPRAYRGGTVAAFPTGLVP